MGGGEGVGVVKGRGEGVTELDKGDWVIPAVAATGEKGRGGGREGGRRGGERSEEGRNRVMAAMIALPLHYT